MDFSLCSILGKKTYIMFFISLIKILLLFCEVLPRGIHEINSTSRRSQRRYSVKNGVIKNFGKFTGQHLCHSLFNKVTGIKPATLLKRRLWHRFFPVNIAKFLRTSFFTDCLCMRRSQNPLNHKPYKIKNFATISKAFSR